MVDPLNCRYCTTKITIETNKPGRPPALRSPRTSPKGGGSRWADFTSLPLAPCLRDKGFFVLTAYFHRRKNHVSQTVRFNDVDRVLLSACAPAATPQPIAPSAPTAVPTTVPTVAPTTAPTEPPAPTATPAPNRSNSPTGWEERSSWPRPRSALFPSRRPTLKFSSRWVQAHK